MRSIEHTWLCAISHIFHITGSGVKLISDFTGTVAFGEMLIAVQENAVFRWISFC